MMRQNVSPDDERGPIVRLNAREAEIIYWSLGPGPRRLSDEDRPVYVAIVKRLKRAAGIS